TPVYCTSSLGSAGGAQRNAGISAGNPQCRRLSELSGVFQRNFLDLLPGKLLWRHAGRIAGLAEKAVEAGRRHHPEEQDCVTRILKAVPGVSRNEDRAAFFKGMTLVVQQAGSAALENVEGFVHLEVAVDRNAGTRHHLLSAPRKTGRAGSGTTLYEDVAAVAEMDEVFTSSWSEHISFDCRRCGSNRGFGE